MAQGIGIGLSQRFYESLVAPLFKEQFPDLPYCACRIGWGSEVLGYDTKLSADHDYGPCVQIFLAEDSFPSMAEAVMHRFDEGLPSTFEGWPVRFSRNVRPPKACPELGLLGSDHGVEIYTLSAWCKQFLRREFIVGLTLRDWLCYPEQFFLLVTAGSVFRDDLGELTALRDRMAYFPRDVWLYKLAAQWGRIAEERVYVGRTGDVGDEIGSRIIASRMAENIMRLGMLIERRYAPYPKWIGTAFARLDCATDLTPLLERVLSARIWQDREDALLEACNFMANLQVRRDIPGAITPIAGTLHGRPYRFIDSLKIIDALRSAIADDDVRSLPECGAADQFINSNYVLVAPDYTRAATTALLDMGSDNKS
jgi:hypothetical protein